MMEGLYLLKSISQKLLRYISEKLIFLFLLLFCLLFANIGKSQSMLINGKVLKQGGVPLAGVNISMILPCKDSLIVSFASSDQDGNYTINLKDAELCDQIVLAYNKLGYLKKEIAAKVINNGKIHINDVTLFPQNIFLNEVIVKIKPNGFSQSNDTTNYRVSQYTDGTENKLEDILKKLPGISVSANGTVSFQGKNIDKILVEGDDFFSKNYTMLSKNISANLIESIEALDNFNDEKLLNGISQSDKVVLNLKLRKDKAALFGNVDAALGTSKRYNTAHNIFTFYKKIKFALLGNFNNVGEESVTDIQYNLRNNDGSSKNLSNQQLSGIRTPFKSNLPTNPDVERNRYIFNKAFTEGVQFNYNLSSKLKFNLYSFLNTDNQKIGLAKNTQYLFPDSGFSVSEHSIYKLKPQTISSNLKMNYQLSESSSLTYNIVSNISSPDFFYNLELSPMFSGKQNDLINGFLSEGIKNLNNRLVYTRRLAPNKAIVLEGEYLTNKNNSYLKQDTNRFTYLNELPSTWQIQQNADLYFQNFESTFKILGSYKSHIYFVSLNTNQDQSKLSSFYFGSSMMTSTPPKSLNEVVLRNSNFVFEAHDYIKRRNFELDYGFKVLRSIQKFQVLNDLSSNKLNVLFFLPKASFKYKFDVYNSFTLAYEKNRMGSFVTDIYNNYIISDYLSAIKGTDTLNNNISQDISFRYKYSNSNNQWIMYFLSNAHLESKPYLMATSINNQLLLRTYKPSTASSNFFYNRFQSDKYIRFLKSNLRFIISNSQIKINSIINKGTVQSNVLKTISMSAAINTAFDIPINFHLSATYKNSKIELNPTFVRNDLIKYDISTNLNFLNACNLKIVGSNYNWSSEGVNSTANFIDFYMRYKKVKQKWSVGLSGLNILKTNDIAFNESDNFILSQSSLEIYKRYFLVSFSYSF